MKQFICALALLVSTHVQAQFPITEIIKAGITKVIVAVDLKIQKLQNKTLWLQNAQKVIENQLSKIKLTEISDWVSKQKQLYQEYFDELQKVKQAVSSYHKVRDLISDQAAMIKEYKAAWAILKQDRNFNDEERRFMEKVYNVMLNEAMKQLDQLQLVIQSYATSMSDARRLSLIDALAEKTEAAFIDLKSFNNQNKAMSLQRSYEKGELDYSRRLYGF